jgi:hypothetical protein
LTTLAIERARVAANIGANRTKKIFGNLHKHVNGPATLHGHGYYRRSFHKITDEKLDED